MEDKMRLIDAGDLWSDIMMLPHNGDMISSEEVEQAIKDAHTVDAAPVVHGWWEPRADAPGFVRCSHCRDCNVYDDWLDGKKWNYCPNCGARMDGEGSKENG